MAMDNPSLVDCFVNLPPLGDVPVPLSFEACAAAQAQDAMLQQKLVTNPAWYVQNQLAPNANVFVIFHSRMTHGRFAYRIPSWMKSSNGTTRIWAIQVLNEQATQLLCTTIIRACLHVVRI